MSNKLSFIQKVRNKIKQSGKNNSIEITNNKTLKLVNNTIYMSGNNNKLIIKENVIIRNSTIEIVGDNCTIIIENNCMIGDNSYLSCKDNSTLTIKEHCGLSRNVKIMTSDGHPIFQNGKCINKAQDVTINHKVWIADNVTILKGVNIGANSVIGIGSIVTKSAPENVILAGNPAKIVKENITWSP